MTLPDARVWVVIVVLGVATWAIRASFLSVAHRMVTLPESVREALRMVPAAVLAALTLPALLRPDGDWHLLGPRALAGLVAAVVAWRTGSALATVVVGMAAVVVFGQVM